MALILSIETSLDVCAVAIHKQGILINTLEILTPRSHAAQLAVLIQKVCDQSSLSLRKIQAVAVSAGPGSYTGLRIGASTAKGLCYGLRIPLIAVNTLDIITREARQRCEAQVWICPLIDARRMDVFYKLVDEHDQEILPTSAATLQPEFLRQYLDEGRKICFAGNAAGKCRNVVQHTGASFISDIYPSATVLGELAFEKWKQNNWEDPALFEPMYAKEFFTTSKS